jgi:hypothetical protein
VQLLAGPRQVGKTTVLLGLADELRDTALYVAGDAAEAALPGFWERLWARAEEVAETQRTAVVLLDEVQHLANWSARLKTEWDRIKRRRIPIHIIATGSSALHLGAGSRESLAGRFERLTLAHWSAASLAEAFGIPAREAAELVVRIGSYPGAFPLRDDRARWAAYVRDAILEPAIGRDILALAAVRRPALLRQVFAIAASAPAQIIALHKLQGQLQDAGALETLAHYLVLLEDAFLVAALDKHAVRPLRRRSSPPKLVTLNNAFLAVTDPEGIPDPVIAPARFGAWVENACLAYAWNAGQTVTYWREEPLEVDGVCDGSWGRWAIEVKTGGWGLADLAGLLEFTRRHPTYHPLVVCDAATVRTATRAGIDAMPWTDFLISGPPATRA